ncbi:TPA_asm: hypothetical protein G4P47_004568 [Salmonella enterica subsp. enterica serovar Javiana]|uniref:Uncharacterized protein n=1 Tax=Salmonella enterica subsp. enterica serovar Javiana TaxID=363569 RepID=A0A736PJC8_SALET|nr:hypothetical protein [Salmonella enterica subsp. enterica serovar Javiana]
MPHDVSDVVWQKEEKPRVIFQLTRGSILILDTSRLAAYCAKRKEKKAMKLPRSTLFWCVFRCCALRPEAWHPATAAFFGHSFASCRILGSDSGW